jgi:hydroxypyruvate isomerase
MLKWSVNLTMLFKEVSFLERFDAAAQAGFGAVEFMWPTGIDLDALVAQRFASGVEVALFNVDSGDVAAGERGFPNDPTKREWWRSRTALAIELAGRLGCSQLNVQAGNDVPGLSRAAILDCLSENLTWALQQSPNITFLLEPLNRFEHPQYILGRTSEALEVIQHVNNPRLKLQFDIYHTQRTEGNLTQLIQTHINQIQHIQIADSPARHQPGTGEINWKFLFSKIEQLEYDSYIGLEYIPQPNTPGSFDWLPFGKRVTSVSSDLSL